MNLENREDVRSRALKGASITFDGGAIDCTVRNLSAGGAALDVASPLGIPEQFMLVVPIDNTHRTCRVVWRKEKRIGVAFR